MGVPLFKRKLHYFTS